MLEGSNGQDGYQNHPPPDAVAPDGALIIPHNIDLLDASQGQILQRAERGGAKKTLRGVLIRADRSSPVDLDT